MVIDELIVRDGITNLPIDSYNGQMIEEIIIEEETFHFATQKDVTGTSEIVAENGVAEPIRSLSVSGATSQSGTPTPETPIPIENANDNGMSVTLHGDNLLPIGKDNYIIGKTITNLGITYSVQEDGGIHCKGKKTSTYSYWALCFGAYLGRYSKGTYRFSLQGNVPNKVNLEFRMYRGTTSIQSGNGQNYTRTLTDNEKFQRFSIIIETDEEIDCVVYPMVNYGTVALPFKKGYYEEIAIPESVEVDGATVDLNMASISIVHSNGNTYTAIDYLTVDRLSNKVLYRQNVGKKTLTSDMDWRMSTYNEKLLFHTSKDIGSKKNYNPVIANKYLGFAHVGLILSKDYGITTDAVWWGVNNRLTIRDSRFDNLADFKADLDQNPIEIEYGLAEEITHDITNTDLGQSLLALATGKGTNYLEITGHLAPSQTDLSYWEQIVPVTT